jgi:glycosyltransferase involved in cell wall biosynthesis
MPPMPDLSVVMPMRNAEAYVGPAVDSVLAHDTIDLELVVVDDGSTDRSRAIVSERDDGRIRIVDGPQTVVAGAMTTGIEQARGALIARCDADDLYPDNDRLAWQMQWLGAHPQYAAVCGGFAMIDRRGRRVSDVAMHETGAEITDELRHGVARTHLCTYAMRRDAARAVLPFRDWFNVADDVDFQFRFAEVGRVWYEPRVLYCYRLHNDSLTHRGARDRRSFEDEAAKRFALQRRATGADDLQRGTPPETPREEPGRGVAAAVHLQKLMLGRAWQERQINGRGAAIRTGFRACLMRPASLPTWFSWLVLTLRG